MRILFVTNHYPPHEVGGYEQLCRDVAERLAERGHEIRILTSDRGAGKRPSATEPSIHRVLRIQPDYSSRLSPALQFFLTRRRAHAHNIKCFQALVRQFAPHVVFIWNLQGLSNFIAIEAESLSNATVAYWLAGYSPTEPDGFWNYWHHPPKKRAGLRGAKCLMRRMALSIMACEGLPARPQMRHVAVVSEYMRRKGRAEGTLPPHTQVIYNGVELEEFKQPVRADPDGPLVLLQAGRVSPDKGVHTAIEAVGHLIQEYDVSSVRLLVAGSGPTEYEAFLQRLVDRCHVADVVSFLGWLPREKMPELMSQCHVLLLPAVYPEAFARVALEAMTSGLTVIGTLTGGTGELLKHGSTGLAFKAGDSGGLARQIRRLLADPGLRRRLAAAGQKLVLARFGMEQMVDRIEQFLIQACICSTTSS